MSDARDSLKSKLIDGAKELKLRVQYIRCLPDHRMQLNDLPKDWDAKPPTLTTQTIGDDFVNYNQAAILKVPSSIVAQEFNYLINPNHPDFSKIKVINRLKMSFDSRIKQEK
jgi:RES domain-containing protein